MGKRFAKQLGQFIVTLFGITFLTFCLTYLAPGDPVTMLLETADTIVSQESYVSRYIISIYIALCIAGRDYKRLKSKQMDRLSVARCFLCRRVYAIILVRPCTDLYLWP